MVLADAPMRTSDSDALALGDVFQAAMAGVQEYQRVQIESSPQDLVNGSAAADVVHLMTELVDNALAFSPPTAPVKISTKQAGDSIIVEISDGGLGIAQDVLISLNEELRSGGEVTVETGRRMGLLVVSRLAKRHGLAVSLARNTRGGTTATVLIPPKLLRSTPAPVVPKARPGLAGLTPAKSVLPASVTEQLSNEAEPTRLPTRPEPVAPAAPAAAFARPEAPAAAGAPAAKAAEVEVDSISAAINAVTRLPQRSPGATRGGGAMPGAAPAGGGSLFQRLQASANQPPKPELPRREPAPPTTAFDSIDPLNPLGDATPAVEEPVEEPAAELDGTDAPHVEEPVAETGAVEDEPALDLTPAPVEALRRDAEERAGATLGAVAAAATSSFGSPNGVPHAAGNGSPAGPDSQPAPVAEGSPVAAYDLLDPRSPAPESTEDETPIFRSLRSRWLSTGADATWSTSEIEAGWEAAEQVAEAPALQVSESGLPMRRPGKRLVPGGVTPAPAEVVRDPEAIRARLAAHAAGVSRGRTAAVDDPAPAPTPEEGPA
jgi:hypothetical protein